MPQQSDGPHDWTKPPNNWAERQARGVALEIRRLRGKRSAQWLANRTDELGYHVTRSVVSDLEIGRRRYVTTAELVVLAEALETAPVALLYPPPYDESVEALPDLVMPGIGAVEWFSGSWDSSDGLSPAYIANLEPLARASRIKSLQMEANRLVLAIESLRDDGIGGEAIEALTKRLREVSEQIRTLRAGDGG